jgi:hypothetical protein
VKRRPKRSGGRKTAPPSSRHNVLMVCLTRAAMFTAAATANAITLQVLTLELALAAAPPTLRNPFMFFAALLFSLGMTAIVGSIAGFHFVRNRVLLAWRVLTLGAIFGAAAFFLFFPVLNAIGVYAGAAAYVVVAAVVAVIGGRFWSRPANSGPAACRPHPSAKH